MKFDLERDRVSLRLAEACFEDLLQDVDGDDSLQRRAGHSDHRAELVADRETIVAQGDHETGAEAGLVILDGMAELDERVRFGIFFAHGVLFEGEI